MKRLLMVIVAFLCISLSSTLAYAEPLNLNQILEATCRVGSSVGKGSGTAVARDDLNTYILTNAHVVGKANKVKVEFFASGRETSFSGEVIWRMRRERTDVDFAVVSIPNSEFGDNLPRIIPLAPEDYTIKQNDYISSAGCPSGRWAVGWEGYIIGNGSSRLFFTPPPIGGQSGSGIHVLVPDEDGELHTRTGAVLTWRIGTQNQVKGGAIPVTTLYALMNGDVYQPINIPENYIEVAHICSRCTLDMSRHMLGTDGNLYCPSSSGITVLPEGVLFVQMGPIKEEQCNPWRRPNPTPIPDFGPRPNPTPIPGPRPDLRPRPNPDLRPPNNNDVPPIGSPWPTPGPKTPNVDDLKKEIDDLKAERDQLNDNKTTLENRIVELEGSLGTKTQEYEATKLELLDAQREYIQLRDVSNEEIAAKKAHIDGLQDILQEQRAEINTIKGELGAKDGELGSILKEIKQLNQQNSALSQEVKKVDGFRDQRNIFGGGTLFGVLILLGGWLYKKFGRKKIVESIDNVEDIIQERLEKRLSPEVGQIIRDRMENLEDHIGKIIDSRLGEVPPSSPAVEVPVVPLPPEQFIQDEGKEKKEKINPHNHPMYRQPPPAMFQEPTYKGVGTPKPELPTGLGPCPPNYPVNEYSTHEVLEAIDEVARSHGIVPADQVPILVRQILESPMRPRRI